MSRAILDGRERALRRLELDVRRRLDGLLTGDRLGLRPGPGSDADESRVYQPGQDDVRRIDWNVSARSLEPQVRVPQAEHELTTWALVDASASMDFGTATLEKRDLAAAIVAAVTLLADGPGNQLGVRIAHGTRLRRIPARSGMRAGRRTLGALLALPRAEAGDSDAAADLADALRRLHREHPRAGLRIVASDFLEGPPASPTTASTALDPALGSSRTAPRTSPARPGGRPLSSLPQLVGGVKDRSERGDHVLDEEPRWAAPLRRLAARHEVIAVEIVDPRELELPPVGLLTLVDPETGRRREVHTSRRLRRRYAAAAADHRRRTAAAIRASGAAHLVLRTDRDWVRDVAEFALARRRTVRRTGRSLR